MVRFLAGGRRTHRSWRACLSTHLVGLRMAVPAEPGPKGLTPTLRSGGFCLVVKELEEVGMHGVTVTTPGWHDITSAFPVFSRQRAPSQTPHASRDLSQGFAGG